MLSTEESTQHDSSVVEEVTSTVNVVEATESDVDGKNSLTVEETSNETQKEEVTDEAESVDEATALLEQGKHLLLVNDYMSAVNILLSACCKFCKIYGDLSNECGDAYYYYGCALLELGKSCKNQTVRILKERKSVKDSKTGGDTENIECSNGENGNENLDNIKTQMNCSENGNGSRDHAEKVSTEDVNQVCDEESISADVDSDGQLASQILKVAEFIFLRENNDAKLIDIYSKLSEADVLLENYTDAVTHCEKCLTLHEKQTNLADKKIALALMQLGTAYLFCKQYYTAVKHFTSAGVVLERSIRHLLRTTDPCDDLLNKEIYDEVDEIREILQTVKDKICDVEDLIRESMKSDSQVVNSMTSKGNNSKDVAGLPISESQANVISHLLRRKRKLLLNNGSIPKRANLDTN